VLNRTFTRRLTPWLTLYLLVASIGIPLQRVYCACVRESSLILAGGEHECVVYEPKPAARDHHRTACCKITSECRVAPSDDHGCGYTDVIVAQFDENFLAKVATGFQLDLANGVVPAGTSFQPLTARVLVKECPIRGPDPPDHPTGRQLLVAHQTFLI